MLRLILIKARLALSIEWVFKSKKWKKGLKPIYIAEWKAIQYIYNFKTYIRKVMDHIITSKYVVWD